jgi:hypothetical protein
VGSRWIRRIDKGGVEGRRKRETAMHWSTVHW